MATLQLILVVIGLCVGGPFGAAIGLVIGLAIEVLDAAS